MINGYEVTTGTLVAFFGFLSLVACGIILLYKIKSGISEEAEEKASIKSQLKKIDENAAKIKDLDEKYAYKIKELKDRNATKIKELEDAIVRLDKDISLAKNEVVRIKEINMALGESLLNHWDKL